MGLLRDKFVKDPKKKELMTWGINIFIVIFLIGVALYAKQEWMSGYNFCKESCLVFNNSNGLSGWNLTWMNGSEFNITSNLPITSVMTALPEEANLD